MSDPVREKDRNSIHAQQQSAMQTAHSILALQRRAEEELLASKAALEEQTKQLALSEARYRAQAEELKRSNADLEQFAAMASHDLQEPLRGVAGCLHILESKYKNSLDPKAFELIDLSVKGVIHMKQLVVDLLALSRISSRPKEFEPTDLIQVIIQVLEQLETAIHESGTKVTYDTLPTVLADRTQLVQLFQNLIGNAIKFCKNEQPEIYIGSKYENNQWIFSVKDNGIGFAPKYADQIFLPFKRLHSRDVYAGTGIGLAICKRIVERHGGEIWATSESEKGAIFYFTLPDLNKSALNN